MPTLEGELVQYWHYSSAISNKPTDEIKKYMLGVNTQLP